MKNSLLIVATLILSAPTLAQNSESEKRIITAKQKLAELPMDTNLMEAQFVVADLTKSDIDRMVRSLSREERIDLHEQVQLLKTSTLPLTVASLATAEPSGLIDEMTAPIIALYKYVSNYVCETLARRNHPELNPEKFCDDGKQSI